jgi:hypothetical protein
MARVVPEPNNHTSPQPEAKIEISLNRLSQLFNSLDPSPFHERDLDQDAEDYIIGSAEEISHHRPFRLVIHLPADQVPEPGAPSLADAVHNFFLTEKLTNVGGFVCYFGLAVSHWRSVWLFCFAAWHCEKLSFHSSIMPLPTFLAKDC